MSFSITLLIFVISVISQLTSTYAVQRSVIPLETKSSNGSFSSILFNLISTENGNQNLIISPFSIQYGLTLLYMGAKGDTAKEFQQVLKYRSEDKYNTALDYSSAIQSMTHEVKAANRIYTKLNLVPKFNEDALKYFQAEAEVVDFKMKEQDAKKINAWVEENTNNKIKDLISPDAINNQTEAILVNALYFKAKWIEPFNQENTKKEPFYVSETESVNVDMMSEEMSCKYGSFPDLDATAIELKYEESEMVMDVILPNKRDGLKDLEHKLLTVDLAERFANITENDVNVKLPKFKIEFDTGLIPVLEEMGMTTSFMSGANFDGLFKNTAPVRVSDVVHKAFIEVDEFGCEAAAATYFKLQLLILTEPITFLADHPFMFVIRSPEAVVFMGHIKNFANLSE